MNSMLNIGCDEGFRKAMNEMGLELENIRDMENGAALGNGDLGRLAACFLDSMATLGIPATATVSATSTVCLISALKTVTK